MLAETNMVSGLLSATTRKSTRRFRTLAIAREHLTEVRGYRQHLLSSRRPKSTRTAVITHGYLDEARKSWQDRSRSKQPKLFRWHGVCAPRPSAETDGERIVVIQSELAEANSNHRDCSRFTGRNQHWVTKPTPIRINKKPTRTLPAETGMN
jgi:thioesterase domain-containing protein